MDWHKTIPVVVSVCMLIAGCSKSPKNEQTSSETVANVVTEDIQAGIEHHIEEQNMAGTALMWIPLPSTDAFQTVDVKSIEAPGQQQIVKDRDHGNRVLLLTLGAQDSGKTRHHGFVRS